MKSCSKCSKEKDLDCFYKSTYHKGGYRNDCKECCIKYNKERYFSSDEIRESRKKAAIEYQLNNKEKERDRQRSDIFRLSRRKRFSVRI